MESKTLEKIIFGASIHQIKIPKYQRPYSWETLQVEEYQDYNLHPIYMITSSFQTKNRSAFCTANQSTNTNLRI